MLNARTWLILLRLWGDRQTLVVIYLATHHSNVWISHAFHSWPGGAALSLSYGPRSLCLVDGSSSVAPHSGSKNGIICQQQAGHLVIQSDNIVHHGLKLLRLE